jgi:hypothetical protein
VIDMVSEPGEAGARHNELERLRDPSHTRALEEDELLDALAAASVEATIAAERRQRLPAVPWLERAASPDAPRERILAALEEEAAGGPPTGLHAARRVAPGATPSDHGEGATVEAPGDGLAVEQRWIIASGRRR